MHENCGRYSQASDEMHAKFFDDPTPSQVRSLADNQLIPITKQSNESIQLRHHGNIYLSIFSRSSIVVSILRLFFKIIPDCRDMEMKSLINIAKYVEERLYSETATKDEYLNESTLHERIKSMVANIRPEVPYSDTSIDAT